MSKKLKLSALGKSKLVDTSNKHKRVAMEQFADYYENSKCDISPYVGAFCNTYQLMFSAVSQNAIWRSDVFGRTRTIYGWQNVCIHRLFRYATEILDIVTQAMDTATNSIYEILTQFGFSVREIRIIKVSERPSIYSNFEDFIKGITNGKITCLIRRDAIVDRSLEVRLYEGDKGLTNLFNGTCCAVIDVANSLAGLFAHITATIHHYIMSLQPDTFCLYSGVLTFPYINVRTITANKVNDGSEAFVEAPLQRENTSPPSDEDSDTTDMMSLESQCADEDVPTEMTFLELDM